MCSGNLENSLSKSMYLSQWSTSFEFNVHHIPHTGTWLRGEQSGKCCSISYNSIMLLRVVGDMP